MASPRPVSPGKEQPSQTEILGGSHDSLESTYDSSNLDNDELTTLFVSDLVNEQISCCEKSFGDQISMEDISENAHFDDIQILPFPSSENVPALESIGSEPSAHELVSHTNNTEVTPVSVCVPDNQQVSESEKPLRTQSSAEEKCDSSNVRSVLVSGTAMCLDLDDIKGQVRVIIEKNLEEHIPLAVSAPRRSPVKDEQRTSKYHGVTRHFWTGKFEAHLWDSSYIREGQRRKGKQVFLGQYNIEEKAARAYDLAALKYWGPSAGTRLNFPISSYEKELEEMNQMSREEFVMYIRRQSSFKIGSSVYRGVTRHGDGRWQARISGIPGKRGLHLGTFGSEEEAAKAYDIASIKFRGIKAFTNFDVSNYCQVDLKELEGQPEPKKSKKNLHLASSTIVLTKSDPQQANN